MAGASKSVQVAGGAVEDPENSTLSSALKTFVRNTAFLDFKQKEAKEAFGDDAEAIEEALAKAQSMKRPAAGYLEGFQATVLGIKANEAVLGRKRIELKSDLYELG